MSEFTKDGRILTGKARGNATHLDGFSRRELQKMEAAEGRRANRENEFSEACRGCEDVGDCPFDYDLDACGEMLSGLCARCHKPITADHHLFCEAGEEGRDDE